MDTHHTALLARQLLILLLLSLFPAHLATAQDSPATPPDDPAAPGATTIWHNYVAFGTGTGWAWQDDWGCCGQGTQYHVGNFDGVSPNGKTMDDLLFTYRDTTARWRVVVALSTGSGLSYKGEWASFEVDIDVHTGDFTGDGRDDLLINHTSGGVWHNMVCPSTGSAFGRCDEWLIGIGEGREYHIGNFHDDHPGDGRADLLLYDPAAHTYEVAAAADEHPGFERPVRWLARDPSLQRHSADFSGDGLSDILTVYVDAQGVWQNEVCVSNGQTFTSCSVWLSNMGKDRQYHVGHFDGPLPDGRNTTDLLLSYQDSGAIWHHVVFTATGSLSNPSFARQWDWGCCGAAGLFDPQTAFHLGDYSGDGKTDLLAAVGQSAPANIVYRVGNKLKLNGQDYFVKGANYSGGSFISAFPKNGRGEERYDRFVVFLQDFSAPPIRDGIRSELVFLRDQLGVNTIRLFTPGYEQWRPLISNPNTAWFSSSGAISPTYLQKLITFLDIAQSERIKVQLELLHNVTKREWICNNTRVPEVDPHGPMCTTDLPTYRDPDGYPALAPPGSAQELFYLTYLRSLIPALKNHPAILAYEVGNENLISYEINYNTAVNPWYQQRGLSYVARMIREIRRLDPNHLVTSGEVVSAPDSGFWHYPSAEFASISDAHHLNGWAPYSLYALVDAISPHFYSKTDRIDMIAPYLSGLAQRGAAMRPQKPITLGEFGYHFENVQTVPNGNITTIRHFWDPPPEGRQQQHFDEILSESCANGLGGYQVWDPLPVFSGYDHAMILTSTITRTSTITTTVNGTPTPTQRITVEKTYNPLLNVWPTATAPQRKVIGYSLTYPLFSPTLRPLSATLSYQRATYTDTGGLLRCR